MRLFDSHSHYFDARFENDADRILTENVFGTSVGALINVGTNNENNLLCISQAARYDKMYCAVGIHPEDAQECIFSPEKELVRLADIIGDDKSRSDKKIVAIGEIGFDFHREGYDRALQETYFGLQMELAHTLGLPVIIHDREAHGSCFDMIMRYPDVRGVFHSYSGSAELALELVRRGWYISFSGVLTFKNARKVREVAQAVPMDRLLAETDCPYLAPHPHRGELNHSGLMEYTVRELASIKGVELEEMAKITFENAETLFSVNC
ncbi:MAG: TatD family hydrolase [Eubacteriales bacterium]